MSGKTGKNGFNYTAEFFNCGKLAITLKDEIIHENGSETKREQPSGYFCSANSIVSSQLSLRGLIKEKGPVLCPKGKGFLLKGS